MFKQNLDFKEFLDLSKKNYSLQITNDADEYPRLSDIVVNSNIQNNRVVSDIKISRGSSMNPRIIVTTDVEFALECQRCLGSLIWNESLNIDCEIINDDESSLSNEIHINRITVDEGGISIAKIIEDEILSIIPMSIMHKSIELCENNDTLSLFLSNNETKETLDKKKRPFSELSKILKKGKK